MSEDLSHLIDDICSPEPAQVAAALQAAAPHRDALAPALLARLLQAATEPQRWTGIDEQPSPIFLLYLAAAWKLENAHPLVVALLRLPPEDCDAVLGDFITEGGRKALADTWPGNLGAIEALIFDSQADSFARGAGMNAVALLVARDRLPRETALALLSRCAALPLDPDSENDAAFADQIISTALDLSAWELRGTITTLHERGLADPFFCGSLEDVLDELPEGAPFTKDSYRFPPPIVDAWEEVKGWDYFDTTDAEGRQPASDVPEFEEPQPKPSETRATNYDSVTYRREAPKIGRNDPCPCGSGKKYKKCCGA